MKKDKKQRLNKILKYIVIIAVISAIALYLNYTRLRTMFDNADFAVTTHIALTLINADEGYFQEITDQAIYSLEHGEEAMLKAKETKDKYFIRLTLSEASNYFNDAENELKDISPPEELKIYHNYLLKGAESLHGIASNAYGDLMSDQFKILDFSKKVKDAQSNFVEATKNDPYHSYEEYWEYHQQYDENQ